MEDSRSAEETEQHTRLVPVSSRGENIILKSLDYTIVDNLFRKKGKVRRICPITFHKAIRLSVMYTKAWWVIERTLHLLTI